jgi:hypothetical protein
MKTGGNNLSKTDQDMILDYKYCHECPKNNYCTEFLKHCPGVIRRDLEIKRLKDKCREYETFLSKL